MGRSYQLIATACKDHFVRIFKLTEISATQSNPPQTPQPRNASQSKLNLSPSASPNQSQAGKRYKVEVLAAFDDHQAEVRKPYSCLVSSSFVVCVATNTCCRYGEWNGI